MNISLAIAMLLFGAVFGVFAWRRATKLVYRRSLFDEGPPSGMSRREHERAVIRQRKFRRLVSTILYVLLGAAIGAVAWALFFHVSTGVPAVGIAGCVARGSARKRSPEVTGGYLADVLGAASFGRQASTAS